MTTVALRTAFAAASLSLAAAVPCAAQTKVVRVHSAILNEDRIVHVNLPPNYSIAKRRYEVIYLLDGHVRQFFDLTVAAAAYDLTGDTHGYAMPPQIVVGVDQRDRGEDLSRNQDSFRRFLVEELVPYVDRTYRTSGFRTLIGHSLGGRFALMTFCRSPGVFPAVIAISAAGDSSGASAATSCLASAFASDTTTLRQLVLSAGDREARTLAGVQRLGEFLRANAPRNWRWTIVPGVGLGHTETPLATIPPGLHFIQDKSVWEMPPSMSDSVTKGQLPPDEAIRSFYAALGKRVGSPVSPSLKWMLAVARVHIEHRDGDAADAARRVIDAYPEDLEAYGMLADLARARGDNALARQTLSDARAMLDRLDLHDVYDRERKRLLLDRALADIPR